ncbi:DegT/DnrJ/EryC1/StrS family aminotransferase [Runella slithyformis]|uniref:Glutamine--scyllo-inositol transaminase n=1 Tax=Runella slithyformis (strain ATCC 29530 / DSM 19594 / LMG 11500 / NCIMB 11436 / LSU 4) TaxID=761193 RepID=A0A7U3ZN65_RUNSL|nr:DegT/DnrJ/EryC1/StrS family aminotransferase [Runella slithyformis]AEI50300.1 Glutamine--scyllo-inositol transaminase [Runella slithyformis DSM 19594]
MKIPFVDLHAQYMSIKAEIDDVIKRVITESAFIGGHYVQQFENDFANYLNVNYCIGCANGTDSIEILLQAHGINRGDEVIVPAHSWFSTSEAVTAVGGVPIFVDVLPNQYVINPALIEEKITPRTKAIIPVHLYGMAADMDDIISIAEKHNLIVIEDCAQAHGAMYKGRKVGTLGHSASFSFYPGKNLGAYGDAGGMVTNDSKIADFARMIARHGQKGKHNHLIEGRNSRLDGLHAAILSTKLPHLNLWNESRRSIAARYTEFLNGFPINLPEVPEERYHVYHLYVIQSDRRDLIKDQLKLMGIDTAIHYPTALPLLPAYAHRGYTSSDFPIAAYQADRILSLPIYSEMNEEQIDYLFYALDTILSKNTVP